MSAPLLEVRELRKWFPLTRGLLGRRVGEVRAVDGISLDVWPGETLSLVGESGCGKTTAARTLLRLLEPTGGSVRYRRASDAEPVDLLALSQRELRRVRRELQLVFQDPWQSLNPRLSVADIVGEALHVHGLARGAELERRVAALLERVGLPADARQRFPHEFSAGQRQRIGVARALALEPRLVVCDEAVSALDVAIQAQILNLLRELQEQLGLAYLFVAHDLSVVRYISDRVAVMYLGRIVEIGPAASVFARPAHPYTQALLAAAPLPDPRRREERRALRGEVPSALHPPSGCHFRTRCPVAEERCALTYPALVPVAGESDGAGRNAHLAACHLIAP